MLRWFIRSLKEKRSRKGVSLQLKRNFMASTRAGLNTLSTWRSPLIWKQTGGLKASWVLKCPFGRPSYNTFKDEFRLKTKGYCAVKCPCACGGLILYAHIKRVKRNFYSKITKLRTLSITYLKLTFFIYIWFNKKCNK